VSAADPKRALPIIAMINPLDFPGGRSLQREAPSVARRGAMRLRTPSSRSL
jgi:hypothetical protein